MSAIGSGITGILEAMGQLGASVAGRVEGRMAQLRAAIRTEIRRAASALALAIVAALLSVATLTFGAVAILIAAWATHPVLAAALIALGFGMLAIVAVLLMRSSTR
jgi:hypothetical protein